jgi:hypothetical protein
MLIERPPDASHRVLNDDRDSLVAASGSSFIHPQTKVLVIEFWAIVINKVMHTSRWVVASEDGSVNIDVRGACVGG